MSSLRYRNRGGLVHIFIVIALFSPQQQHAVPAGGQGDAHPPLRVPIVRA